MGTKTKREGDCTYTWTIDDEADEPLYVTIPPDPRWETEDGRAEIAREVDWLSYKHGVLNQMHLERSEVQR